MIFKCSNLFVCCFRWSKHKARMHFGTPRPLPSTPTSPCPTTSTYQSSMENLTVILLLLLSTCVPLASSKPSASFPSPASSKSMALSPEIALNCYNVIYNLMPCVSYVSTGRNGTAPWKGSLCRRHGDTEDQPVEVFVFCPPEGD